MPRRPSAGALLRGFFLAVPVYPPTFEIARRVARIDGESKRNGVVIPFQDPIIGVTALEFDYAVATLNVRHFQMIPDPLVKPLRSETAPTEAPFPRRRFRLRRRCGRRAEHRTPPSRGERARGRGIQDNRAR